MFRQLFRSLGAPAETADSYAAAPAPAPAPAEPNTGAGFVPPGHYYSPIPDFKQVERDEKRIFAEWPRTIAGIDMREEQQLGLLRELLAYYREQPFTDQPSPGMRYHFDNQSYAYSDGIFLHCMLRHLKPRRLIEVGSGYSSCVTLDTDDRFLGKRTNITFIEPYPQLLHSLISDADRERVAILPHPLQAVDLSLFDSLEAGDVLFVDSTHVSRVDSDVNRLFFDIFPRLKPGVHIHIHDIFYPFEYPKESFRAGRAWNELYLLRAFLQFNDRFEIVLMNTFMEHFHEAFFREHMPLCMVNPGGSIWLRRSQA
jgi:hypothetical protein